MITISFAIMCTVAVLVFLGWQLNIVESIILSLAVGLSIDYTIHYGVAYRLSNAEATSGERAAQASCSVGSAVTMAALTTFVAGGAVMPCEVLIYVKLGIFLMAVTSFSWLYATFFFQSLCHVIGPSKQCYAACARYFCRHRINKQQSKHRLVL
jgi:predicted RND superfamily exporter protein